MEDVGTKAANPMEITTGFPHLQTTPTACGNALSTRSPVVDKLEAGVAGSFSCWQQNSHRHVDGMLKAARARQQRWHFVWLFPGLLACSQQPASADTGWMGNIAAASHTSMHLANCLKRPMSGYLSRDGSVTFDHFVPADVSNQEQISPS
jgi:hypothetical protein